MNDDADLLPIDDWRLSARGELGPVWPPQPVYDRVRHLDRLHALYDGSRALSYLEGTEARYGPLVRWCKWACDQYSQFLTSTQPTLNGVNVTQPIYHAVTDMCRYGGALLWPDGDKFKVLDPRWWVPTDDGWFYIVPQVSDTSRVVDHALLWVWASGRLSVTAHRFTGAQGSDARSQTIGGSIDIESGVSVLTDDPDGALSVEAAELLVVPALPMRGDYWGTSIIEAGAAWQEQAAARFAGMHRMAGLAELVGVSYDIARPDLAQIAGEQTDQQNYLQRAKAASDALEDWAQARVRSRPAQIQGGRISQYDPPVDAMAMLVEEYRREFEAATATSGLALSAMDGNMTGPAMKWAHAETYQATLSIQNQVRAAVEGMYGDGALEWAHPWNDLETSVLEQDSTDMPPTADDEMR